MRKIDKESFAYQRRWNKFILDIPAFMMPKGYRKAVFIAYCFAMADKGSAGLGCFASDETMAEELGIYNRRDIAKYRKLAKSWGLFTVARRVGRAEHLDINIPNDALRASINPAVEGSCESTPNDAVTASLPSALSKERAYQGSDSDRRSEVLWKCPKLGCEVPMWHEHMSEDMVADASERRQDDEEPKPKHKAAPSKPTRPRAWEDI